VTGNIRKHISENTVILKVNIRILRNRKQTIDRLLFVLVLERREVMCKIPSKQKPPLKKEGLFCYEEYMDI
jgi:hypothetical protein